MTAQELIERLQELNRPEAIVQILRVDLDGETYWSSVDEVDLVGVPLHPGGIPALSIRLN